MSRDATRTEADPSRVRRVLRMKMKYASASSPARSTSHAKSDTISIDSRDRSLAGETF